MTVSPTDAARRLVFLMAAAETLIWASTFYLFPALLPHWEADTGWSKAQISGAFTASLLVAAATAPLAGRLIDEGLGRFVFTACSALAALLLITMSRATELWQFYLIWIGIGVAMAGTLYEACFSLLTRVLVTDAKRAITLVTLIAGFAGTVAFPSNHVLATELGWRSAVIVVGVVVAVVVAPLFWLACRSGEQVPPRAVPVAPQTHDTSPLRRALRSPVFWLLVVAFSMIALAHGLVLTHLLPLLAERGIHPETAVFAAAMIGPMQVVGRLAMMAMEKHTSTSMVATASFVVIAFAQLLLFGAAALPTLLIGFVILHGAGYGVTSITRPVVTAEYLGHRGFGTISGVMASFFLAMSAAAPTVAALLWGVGGYDVVILFALAVAVLGLATFVLAARLHRQ